MENNIPYLNEYLKHMKDIMLSSEYTLLNYPIHLKGFFEFTEGKYNINKHTINKYITYLLDEKKYARKTVNTKLACLRSYYKFLYNEEIIDREIHKQIVLIANEDSKIKDLPSQEEIFKILDAIEDVRDRALLETLYCTGVREGELSALNIEDVDFDNNFITVLKGKGRNGGKTRLIPISKSSLKWLKAYIRGRKSGALFLNNRSSRLGTRSIYNIVYKYFNFPPHNLRHSFATHMIIKTGNMKAVSDMLGHSSVQMTEQIYTHLNIDDLKNIYGQGGMDR